MFVTVNTDCRYTRVQRHNIRTPQVEHTNSNIGYKVNQEFGYCDLFNPSYSLRLLSRVEINTESLT